MKTANIFLILLLAFTFTVTSCSRKDQPKKAADKTEQTKDKKDRKDTKPPVPVEVVKLKRGTIQQTYRTITSLEAENEVSVVARTSGILESIKVEEGDRVVKGQPLAQLDVEQLTLEAEQLQATSRKLGKELKRQQLLFKKRLGSSDALDKARYEFQAQQAQYKLANLKLKYATIRAPISGLISERLVKAGNLISNNDVLFKIVDPLSLKAVLYLPEKELSSISKGQQVFLKVDAFPEKVMHARVERIRPMIDADTGTFKVVASIDNDEGLLQKGMFGRVEIVFNTHKNALLLEQQSIITQDNRSHVFVVRDHKAIQTPIKTGFLHDGVYEVTQGLKDSDLVVSTGQQILKHDVKVEIVGDNAFPKNKSNPENNPETAIAKNN